MKRLDRRLDRRLGSRAPAAHSQVFVRRPALPSRCTLCNTGRPEGDRGCADQPDCCATIKWHALIQLGLQRQRLKNLISDVEHSIKEVRRFEADGERYASYAVAWASTMLLMDILKISLSATDRRAKLLFDAQDKMLAQASKVLQLFGHKPLATKADLLKSMDASLELAPKMTEGIRKGQTILKEAGVKVPKHFSLLLKLGTTMCDAFMLMIDAGKTAQHVQTQSLQGQKAMRDILSSLRQKLLLVEQGYTELFERQQLLSRTA